MGWKRINKAKSMAMQRKFRSQKQRKRKGRGSYDRRKERQEVRDGE